MVERSESWVNVYRFTHTRHSLYHCSAVSQPQPADKFRMILLELRGPPSQSPCVMCCPPAPLGTLLRGYDMPPSQDPLYAGLGQAVRIGTDLVAALMSERIVGV